METIYNWLLQGMGNEGNAYTILNCQRTKRAEGGEAILVMARLKDFSMVNLLIYDGQMAEEETRKLAGDNTALHRHTFGHPDEVLDFLHTGQTVETTTSMEDNGLQVLVFKPVGEAGELTFPPEQTTN